MKRPFKHKRPIGPFIEGITGYKDEIRKRMVAEGLPEPVVEMIARLAALDTTVGVSPGTKMGDGVLVDFNLDVRGVDEESGSRLVLSQDGRLKHGSLRAGEVDLAGSISLDELESRWEDMLTDSGIRLNTDAVAVQMRSVGPDRYVPHIVFGSDGDTSPISPDRLIRVVRELPRLWNDRTDDLKLRSNIGRESFEGTEQTVGNVDDMLENL